MKKREWLLHIGQISPSLDLADCWLFDSDNWFGYRVPSHHLILIEEGTVVAQPPSGKFEARAGDLICFRPAEVNFYGTRGRTLLYQAHLQFAPPPRHRCTPLLGSRGPLPLVVSLGESFPAARRVFEIFCSEVSQTGPAADLRLRAAVLELLAIVTDVLSARPHRTEGLDDWQRLRLRLVSRPQQRVKVADLSREMNLHPNYFIREFKRRFGESPKAFLIHCRLRQAVQLLRSNNEPVKSIALGLGFPSEKSFQRLFKQQFGVRATEVRRKGLFAFEDASGTAAYPFVLNRHNLRPDFGADWMDKFTPRFLLRQQRRGRSAAG
jgi:AraC-like DNA-binding protein